MQRVKVLQNRQVAFVQSCAQSVYFSPEKLKF